MIPIRKGLEWFCFTLQKQKEEEKEVKNSISRNQQGYSFKVLLQCQEQSRFRGFLQSISKVDKQHFSQQIFPKYPICCCRAKGKDPHKTSLLGTKQPVLFPDSSHNGLTFDLNHMFVLDPLDIVLEIN